MSALPSAAAALAAARTAPRPSAVTARLVELASDHLECPTEALSCLFVNGWRMDFSTLTALVFAPGGTGPALVAKAGSGDGAARIRAEAENLERLSGASDARFRSQVPHRLALADQDGIVILLESVARGRPLVPPVELAVLHPLLAAATGWLLRFHAETGSVRAPLTGDDAERLLLAPLSGYLARFSPEARERDLLERMRAMARRLVGRPFPLVVQHDDFCLQNLLWDGTDVEVIDWEAAFVPRLPAFDLFHLLACAGTALVPGDDGEDDAYAAYEQVFFAATAIAGIAREQLERYAAGLGLTSDEMRLLFTVHWATYALEKAEALAAAEASGRAPAGQVWSLARLSGGTCLNLKRLAEDERSFILS